MHRISNNIEISARREVMSVKRYPFCEKSNHGNKKKEETLATNDWRDMSMEALLTVFGTEMKEGIEMRLGKEGNSCNESAGAMML